jgi:hypothetical protein
LHLTNLLFYSAINSTGHLSGPRKRFFISCGAGAGLKIGIKGAWFCSGLAGIDKFNRTGTNESKIALHYMVETGKSLMSGAAK